MPSTLHKDLLGQAIHDFWITGEDLPIEVWMNGRRDGDMSASVFFRKYAQMQSWDRQALRLSKGSVLDVGAGAGSHSLLLEQRGFDVSALEISPLACEVMKARGAKRVMNEDVLHVKGIPFDTVLLLMNGLGLLGTEQETLKLFRHLKKMLTKGGQILGDSTDILYARMDSLGGFQDKGAYYGQVEFILKYKGKQSLPFNWLYLDPSLLAELSDKAGLRCEIMYRSKDFHYLARLT